MLLPIKLKKGLVIAEKQEPSTFMGTPFFVVILSNDEEHPLGARIGILAPLKDLGDNCYLVENEQIYGLYE